MSKRKIKFRLLSISTIVCLSFIYLGGENTAQSATIDDIRELLGQKRLSETYTPEEQEEIISKYTEVEEHNKFILAYDNEHVIRLNKEIAREKKELESSLDNKIYETIKLIDSKALPSEIISTRSEVTNILHDISKIRDEQDILDSDVVENKFTDEYNTLMKHLARLEYDKSNELGDIGATLKSPLLDSFLVKLPFGYNLNTATNQVQFSRGIDLEVVHSPKVHVVWNGIVESIEGSQKQGYMVTVTHGDGLRTRYGNLDTVTTTKGAKLVQYSEIGTVKSKGSRNYVHFEVSLDARDVNPIYFFGEKGANALNNFIITSTDPFHQEMRSIVYEIKKDPKWLAKYREETANPYIPGKERYVEPVITHDPNRQTSSNEIKLTIREDAKVNPNEDVK